MGSRSVRTDQLFTALADQLKVPLLQIARLSEAAQPETLPDIRVISEHTLRLVDAYVQARHQDQTQLLLEPLTTSAVLYDVAALLQPFARQHDFIIDIDTQGKGVPIVAHRPSLATILMLLGSSLMEAGMHLKAADRHLTLGTHRSAKGTVVGAFSTQQNLTQNVLQATRVLHGRATQVVPSFGMAGGASVAIADQLSEQMHSRLRVYRHRSLLGLGTLLIPSRQLELL